MRPVLRNRDGFVALTIRRPSASRMREASLVVVLVFICAALFAWVLLGR